MKGKVMKTLLMACFWAISFTSLLAQTPVRVEVRVEDKYFYVPGEWISTVYADLYDANNNLVAPCTNCPYLWEAKIGEEGTWGGLNGGYGVGLWTSTFDGTDGQIFYVRVHVYLDQSQLVSNGNDLLSKPGLPRKVFIFAKREDDSPMPSVQIQNFTYPHWDINLQVSAEETDTAYATSYIRVTDNDDEYLRVYPNYDSSQSRKFNHWRDQLTELNHDQFYISTANAIFRPEFRPVNGATVFAQFVGGGTGPTIDFRDPWFPDYVDGSRGLRNQGRVGAQWYSQTSFDLSKTSTHQGIFLNENSVFDTTKPLYSVRSQIMQQLSGQSYHAFFQGWSYNSSYATLQQVGSNPIGYDQKAVVFIQSGATVTALYTTSNITTSVTIPAGTYTVAGTVTVASGATLTLSPGTTLQFPASSKLVVSGKLIANGTSGQRIQFTKSGGSTWTGLEFSGSGANGSSITYTTISNATEPVKVTNVSSFTMNNDSLKSADFSINGAMQFYGSSPTISSVVIQGQSGASNGVRFASGSSGSITSSTIRDLGAGNGIVVQGNSYPRIQANTIRDNIYHGIAVDGNGSAIPLILSNTILDNGVVNGTKTYTGMNIKYTSTSRLGSNNVRGSNYGIYWEHSSSANTYWTGSYSLYAGSNTVQLNLMGLVLSDYSYVWFGDYDYPDYNGACNKILSNTTWNAAVVGTSWLLAEGNWWGASPPSLMYHDGTSSLYYDYYLPSASCPGGGEFAAAGNGTPTMNGGAADLREASSASMHGDYAQAKATYEDLLSTSTDDRIRVMAVIGLLDVFRATKDISIIDDIEAQVGSGGDLGVVSREALLGIYASAGRFDEFQSIAIGITRDYPEQEKAALYYLASLKWFDDSQKETSDKYLAELLNKYGSTLDDATLAILGVKSESQGGEVASGTPSPDQGELELSNYPNPFNPSTTIRFTLPSDGHVTLKVYDMLGRVVEDLLNETMTAGKHQVAFNASRLPSGVYFYRMDFGGKSISKKLLLTK